MAFDRIAYYREWRRKPENAEKLRLAAREYSRRPENKAGRRAAQERWRKGPKGKAWQLADVERHRARVIKSRYGITADEYDAMVLRQDGKCAICEKPPARGRLHIDHHHENGAVRGLLCGNCNRALGMVYDSTDILRRMIAYVEAV